MLTTSLYDLDRFYLPLVHRTKHTFLKSFRHPQNRIQGSSEFVAHVRQKFIFEAGGVGELCVGLSQLGFCIFAIANIFHETMMPRDGALLIVDTYHRHLFVEERTLFANTSGFCLNFASLKHLLVSGEQIWNIL